MANAKRCDRCGAFYQFDCEDDVAFNKIRVFVEKNFVEVHNSAAVYDICPKCSADFVTWLSNNSDECMYSDEWLKNMAQDDFMDDPYEDGGL
jgi:hypothetical protein